MLLLETQFSQRGNIYSASASPKVLLIRPPQQFHFGVWPRGPRLSIPTGLLAIGSYLKDNGVDVTIYDAFVEGDDFDGNKFTNAHMYKRSISGVRIGKKWVNWVESGSAAQTEDNLSESSETTHFGAGWKEVEASISAISPDIVGITNLFRENTDETLQTALVAKKLFPDCLVIVGGPNANAVPEELMRKCPAIDFIGFGDGEQIMLELTKFCAGDVHLSSIQNVMYRDSDGNLRRTATAANNQDLDIYGALNYDLIRLERYFAYERKGIMARNKFLYPGADRAVSMVTSRGCPYHCTFCSVHIHAGKKFRRHSVAYLISQIEYLVKTCHVRHIHFEDDNLTLDKERFTALLNAIVSKKIEFTWDTPNGVCAETLDEEMLLLIKRTGCIYLQIGVESGDQWVLDNVIRKQPLKLRSVSNVFEAAQRVGLDLHAFYVIGFPRESMEQINRTLDFALTGLKRYGVIPHLSLARADHGTALYEEASSTNSLLPDSLIGNPAGVRADIFRRHLISTSEFTPSVLEGKNDQFHNICVRYLINDRMKFLVRRPVDLVVVVSLILRDVFVEKMTFQQAVIKMFWCKLLYKNAIMDRAGKRVKSAKCGNE